MTSGFYVKTLEFSGHAIQQMFARGISRDEVRAVVDSHQVIADYPEDQPFPSHLLLGIVSGRPIHVVLGYNQEEAAGYVITVYEPDPLRWEPDFKTRRKP